MKFRKFLAVFLAAVCMMSVFSFNVSAAAEEILGDVNGDGKIKAVDYAWLKQAVMNKKTLTDAQFARGDVTGDGKLSALDYAQVKKHVLGTYTITGTVKPRTAITKIVAAIGKKTEISRDFKSTLNGINADATVSFTLVKKVLHLKGYVEAENGIVLEIDIPMNEIAAEYHLSGTAVQEAADLRGTCKGTIDAASFTDISDFDSIEFTANIPLDTVLHNTLKSNCQEALVQFLYQANILLTQSKTGATIGDLGFTTLYQDILDGFIEY